jgi:hypothetical protein
MGREKRDYRDKGLRDEGLEKSAERIETMRKGGETSGKGHVFKDEGQ